MMASTQSAANVPNYARRIKWLGISAGLVALLYSGGWYWLSTEGVRRLDVLVSEASTSGKTIECANRDIKGYPFRLGLFCDRVSYSDDERGILFNAGALRSAAQIYDPKHAVIELDGPAFIETQEIRPLEFNWSLLHASIRADLPVPEQISIEGKDVNANADGKPAMEAAYASFHLRKENADAAFAGEWDAVNIAPELTPGRTIPPYAISYDMLVKDGVRLIAEKARSARGQSGEIRQFNLIFADGGAIKASGPVSVNNDGLVSGEIKLTFTDPGNLAIALGKAIPEAAASIGPALNAAALTSGSEPSLTLTIRNGKVSTGLFPLGNIPPVQ